MTATKRCALCGLELPISDFGHDGRTRDNLTYRCNTCRAMQTIVPISDENGSHNAPKTSDRNDRAPRGRFVANPHFHGDH